MNPPDLVSQNDLMYFKNDMLGELKTLESKIFTRFDETFNSIEKNFILYENKYLEMKNVITCLSNSITEEKATSEQLEKLFKFKKKTEDTLTTHVNLIQQCSKDISTACYKYDKIFLDNFMVPGLIGPGCKYASMRIYIEACVNQIQNLNAQRDKQGIDLKTYKDKIENLIKQFNIQIEGTKNHLMEYTKATLAQCEGKFEHKYKETDSLINQIKIDNSKYMASLKQQVNQVKCELENVLKEKDEMYMKLEKEKENINNNYKLNIKEYDECKKEFKGIKSKFNEISEFIKNVRFRKNINELNKKELNDIANKISYNKKPFRKDSYSYTNSIQLNTSGKMNGKRSGTLIIQGKLSLGDDDNDIHKRYYLPTSHSAENLNDGNNKHQQITTQFEKVLINKVKINNNNYGDGNTLSNSRNSITQLHEGDDHKKRTKFPHINLKDHKKIFISPINDFYKTSGSPYKSMKNKKTSLSTTNLFQEVHNSKVKIIDLDSSQVAEKALMNKRLFNKMIPIVYKNNNNVSVHYVSEDHNNSVKHDRIKCFQESSSVPYNRVGSSCSCFVKTKTNRFTFSSNEGKNTKICSQLKNTLNKNHLLNSSCRHNKIYSVSIMYKDATKNMSREDIHTMKGQQTNMLFKK